MKLLLLILVVVAGVVWYLRIQKDLATWHASVDALAAVSHVTQGIDPESENVNNLITLLEHKPYRIPLTPAEKSLLARMKGEEPVPAPVAAAHAPAQPAGAPRPAVMTPFPAPVPVVRRTPTPQEVAEAIARKYGPKR